MTIIVFIAGGSGSGKTRLAPNLTNQLSEKGINSATLNMDNSYKPRPPNI